MKPSRARARQLPVNSNPIQDNVDDQLEAKACAHLAELAEDFISRLSFLQGWVNRVVIAGEKNISECARGEKRRSPDAVEFHLAASRQNGWPSRNRPDHHRMHVIDPHRPSTRNPPPPGSSDVMNRSRQTSCWKALGEESRFAAPPGGSNANPRRRNAD